VDGDHYRNVQQRGGDPSSAVRLAGGAEEKVGVPATGFVFATGSGEIVAGPITAILAVRTRESVWSAAAAGARRFVTSQPHEPCNPVYDGIGILVLPCPKNGPTPGRQDRIVSRISRAVFVDLVRPVAGVRLGWQRSVFRASVPEAAVNEEGNPLLREDDVRADGARSALYADGEVDPKSESGSMEPGAHRELERGIASPVRRHDASPRVGDVSPGRASLIGPRRRSAPLDDPTGVSEILVDPMSVLPVQDVQSRPGFRAESYRDLDAEYLRRDRLPAPLGGTPPIAIVDLFAGLGGLTLGALEGARRCHRSASLALAVDSDAETLSVVRATLGGPSECYSTADLSEVAGRVDARPGSAERRLFANVPEDSLLLAGPPCQGHSALNNHTRHDDSRNDLYVAVARAARLVEPKAIIVENVRGVGADRRGAVSRCAAALEKLGYWVTQRRLNLSRIGVPQSRVRHVLVATRERPLHWALPDVPGRDVRWAIEDLLDRENETAFDMPSVPTPANRDRIAWLFAHDEFDLPNELRPLCHHGNHSYRSMYGRLRWDAPAQTITSGFGSMGQGRYVHPLRPRTLTPHEAARLQFLPDFVRFEEFRRRSVQAQAIGNAAPPRLTLTLVEALVSQELL